MSRTARFLASTLLGYMAMVLTTLVNLWFTPFLLRHLGDRDFGLWAVGAPVLTYVSLVDFGVISLLQRDIALNLGEAGGDFRKMDRVPELVGKTFRLVMCQMPVLCAAAALAWVAMPRAWSGLHWPISIVLIALILSFPLRIGHAILVGVQDLSFIGKFNIVTWAIGVIVGAVLVLLGWGLYALAASWAVTQLASSLGFCIRAYVSFRELVPRATYPLPLREAKERLTSGFWIVITQMAVILLNGSDLVILGSMLGPEAVVPYTITDKMITLFATLPLQIAAAAWPALTELKSSRDRHRLATVCAALTLSMLILSGLVACLVIAVDHGFVIWWIGAKEFGGNKLVLVLVVAMLLNHLVASGAYSLFAFGYEKRNSIITMANGLLTAGTTIVFTRYWGLLGPPLATILGLVLITLPVNLVTIARETRVSVAASVRPLLGWAVRFALLAGGLTALSVRWTPTSFWTLAATSVGVTCAYGLVMFPVAFGELLGPYTRPRLAALRARLSVRT